MIHDNAYGKNMGTTITNRARGISVMSTLGMLNFVTMFIMNLVIYFKMLFKHEHI